LIRDLGLEEAKLYSEESASNRYIVRGLKLIPVPDTAFHFFSSELFSRAAKAHLMWEPFVRRSPSDDEESLEQFVVRRLGREFLDYAVDPLVAGIYAGDPARLSVKHAFPKLHALEQRYGSLIVGQILGGRERKMRKEVSKQKAKKVSFAGGLQELINAFEQSLSGLIHFESPVVGIERIPGGWQVLARQGACEHRAVIFATPTHSIARILHGDRLNFAAAFDEVRLPPIASVVFGFHKNQVQHPLDGFGMLVPKLERLTILGAIFSSSLFRYRAPEGHVTITCYAGGCRNPDLAIGDKAVLRRAVLHDLQRLLGIRGEPTFEQITVIPKSIPQYDVGFGKFKELVHQIEASSPGLFFAGNYREGISLGDAIVSAEDASSRAGYFLKQFDAVDCQTLNPS
jgi:oxygen-dependent protoporphyrinogen oxidase